MPKRTTRDDAASATRPGVKHIPIVIISANNETEKIAKDVGADDFFVLAYKIFLGLQIV